MRVCSNGGNNGDAALYRRFGWFFLDLFQWCFSIHSSGK